MRIKKGFILREVAGSFVVVAVGEASRTFKGIIKLNESGAFLWKELEKGVNGTDELVEKLKSEYQVDDITAKEDVLTFLESVKGAKLVEE